MFKGRRGGRAARVPAFLGGCAAQVPGLGPVAFTLGYYWKYAAVLRERAIELGKPWALALVERALWAASGGKVKRAPK